MRRARANALNIVFALMVRVVSSQVVDMQRHLRVVANPEEFVHQIDVELADQRALELDVVLRGRAARRNRSRRATTPRRGVRKAMPVTPNAFLVAHGARHGLTKVDPDVSTVW